MPNIAQQEYDEQPFVEHSASVPVRDDDQDFFSESQNQYEPIQSQNSRYQVASNIIDPQPAQYQDHLSHTQQWQSPPASTHGMYQVEGPNGDTFASPLNRDRQRQSRARFSAGGQSAHRRNRTEAYGQHEAMDNNTALDTSKIDLLKDDVEYNIRSAVR